VKFYWLILGVLAVWRVTHLLQAEDGPWDVVVRLRRSAGNSFWGKLLDCFYCLSVWIALPAAILVGDGWKEILLLWLAFSGGAILLEKLSQRESGASPALFYEDKEDDHVMLRKPEERAPGNPTQPPPV
jgi:hypothetical protein